MKYKRHARILEIIAKKRICTQDEIADELKKSGFEVTQATVSRDIKELKLIKVQCSDGSSRYSVGASEGDNLPKYRKILIEAMRSVDFACNIAVVKCFSGMGMAAATAIDAMGQIEIVGSIAGDDTIIVVLRSEEIARKFVSELRKMLKK